MGQRIDQGGVVVGIIPNKPLAFVAKRERARAVIAKLEAAGEVEAAEAIVEAAEVVALRLRLR